MKPTADRQILWNEAAKAGLILGLFTALFVFTGLFTSHLSAADSFGSKFAGTLLSALLWILKFIGCIWLLRFFMLKFAARYAGVDNRMSFRFGMVTALTSAIITAGVGLLNITVLSPDSVKEAVDTYMSMATLSDSDRSAIEGIMNRLPQITFFTNLIYCFIYGTVASRIMSSSIPPKDIFGTPVGNTSGAGNDADGNSSTSGTEEERRDDAAAHDGNR